MVNLISVRLGLLVNRPVDRWRPCGRRPGQAGWAAQIRLWIYGNSVMTLYFDHDTVF